MKSELFLVTYTSCRLAANAAAYIKKRNELKEKLDKHLAYAHYLEQVMKRSDEFHEIRDVMSRFETLSQTYQVPALLYYVLTYLKLVA